MQNCKFQQVIVEKNEWKSEVLETLRFLSGRYKNVILLLDDFFITELKDNLLNKALECFELENMKNLRLVPPRMQIFKSFYYNFKYRKKDYRKLPHSEPYYSTFQCSIWDIQYLSMKLKNAKNIWDFEHQEYFGFDHYAVIQRVIFYQHLVEKGKWLPVAKKYIPNGKFNKRPFLKSLKKRSIFISRLRVHIFGYLFFRKRK